jgi:hypothetical protein
MTQGVDVYGIKVVVLHGIKQVDASTALQRIGRGARGVNEDCFCFVLYESHYSDQTRLDSAEKAKKRKKRKPRPTNDTGDGGRPKKRRRKAAPADPLAAHTEHTVLAQQPKRERDEILRQKYQNSAAAVQSSGIVKDLDPTMDDFINAAFRCIACRREPFDLLFENDKCSASDHFRCDTDSLTGCERCRPKTASICCDLHNPSAFAAFAPPAAPPALPTVRRIAVKTLSADDADDTDNDLTKALYELRQRLALELFPHLVVQQGPYMVMHCRRD